MEGTYQDSSRRAAPQAPSAHADKPYAQPPAALASTRCQPAIKTSPASDGPGTGTSNASGIRFTRPQAPAPQASAPSQGNPWQQAFQALSASLNTSSPSPAQASPSAYQTTPTPQAATPGQLGFNSPGSPSGSIRRSRLTLPKLQPRPYAPTSGSSSQQMVPQAASSTDSQGRRSLTLI